MRRLILASTLIVAAPASAALAPGAKAPDFTTKGANAGKPVDVALAKLRRQGPVVLYFFPAANTGGCNAEARAFADAIPQFRKAGATVVGMSADDVPTLIEFSGKECAGKFTVARADPAVIAGYDVWHDGGKPVSIKGGPARAISNRTSYVIAPDGRILYAHSDPLPGAHITNTLKAVRDWRAARRR